MTAMDRVSYSPILCVSVGVGSVNREDFVSAWRVSYQRIDGQTATVALHYVVETDETGDKFFFNPSQLCKHVLLKQVCPPSMQYDVQYDSTQSM